MIYVLDKRRTRVLLRYNSQNKVYASILAKHITEKLEEKEMIRNNQAGTKHIINKENRKESGKI